MDTIREVRKQDTELGPPIEYLYWDYNVYRIDPKTAKKYCVDPPAPVRAGEHHYFLPPPPEMLLCVVCKELFEAKRREAELLR